MNEERIRPAGDSESKPNYSVIKYRHAHTVVSCIPPTSALARNILLTERGDIMRLDCNIQLNRMESV